MRGVDSDEVVRLREWGTERTYVMPRCSASVALVGADEAGSFKLADRQATGKHVVLTRTEGNWSIRGLGTEHALRQDGVRRDEFMIDPGVEIGIGSTILVAESPRSIELRSFCARILGWGGDNAGTVDHALRSIRLSASRRTALVLCGDFDLVPIAWALHRRTLGAARPFIVCDPRRGNTPASVRSPANCETGVAAFEAAIGGTLCVRRSSLPRDFASVVALLREPSAAVQLVIGADRRDARHAFLTVPAPVHIPSLKARASELPRIVDEYARDAAAELSIRDVSFSETDRRWVLEHAATSLSEIEKATLRLVALKISTSATQAAARLGMAAVSLSRWVGRRKLPPTWVAAAAVRTAKR